MRQMALLLWFLLVTVLCTWFYQYREQLQEWFLKLRKEQQEKSQSLGDHPGLKWALRVFILLTAIAWLDLVIWGITSVVPLALFLMVFGGKKALKESAHVLLMLSAFWAVCYLLFGMSPSEFIGHFNLQTMCQVYGVSPDVMKPLVIPLVALFFLGIACLIFQTRLHWGIGAILISTMMPFLVGFLFGGKIEGVGTNLAVLLSTFYNLSPDLLKILLIPQSVLVLVGIFLLTKKHFFIGTIWMVLGLLLPWGIYPAKELYLSYVERTPGQNTFDAMAAFYGFSSQAFKILLLIQIALILTSFVVACHRKTWVALALFFLGVFLPWLLLFLQDGIQKFLLPTIQNAPKNIHVFAELYNRPVETIKMLLLPMGVCFLFGIVLLFTKKGGWAGITLILLAIFMPWLSEPAQLVLDHVRQMKVEGISSFYRVPQETLQTLFLPMGFLFLFGLFAMFNERKFWGALLIFGAISLPWIFPVQIGRAHV